MTDKDAEILAASEKFFRNFIPEASAEFRDYGHRIAFGLLDKHDDVQEVICLKREISPQRLEIMAELLRRKLEDANRRLKTDC